MGYYTSSPAASPLAQHDALRAQAVRVLVTTALHWGVCMEPQQSAKPYPPNAPSSGAGRYPLHLAAAA